ncbi:uncharacterized protein LOC114297340 [Camellia sinensis]|uniref:uncharacterized protein LOC114297340 n=1 Tax=Camellia sinensis TaxID=4442 RepID=UPI001035A3C1|nr:uncharacterized protein LOC114297340 [Camellia sinensis]
MAATLNRFISRSIDRCRPFFHTLRQGKAFEWTPECQAALDGLKTYLRSVPLLATPSLSDPLILYLEISDWVVSTVLLKEELGEQRPIYYVSKAMVDAETRYLPLEKLILALVVAARKLMHYFQAHTIGVLTDYLLRSALRNAEVSGRVSKWALELGQYDIQFSPRMTIKGPWSFAQWGLDIIGPLPWAPGNRRFLIVVTDYFTKWVEAEALTYIRDVDVKHFVWKNIITRFGIPRALVSVNGPQFDCGIYWELCNTYDIWPYFSSPAYPRSNGQAEASNKVILDGIKKRLEKAKDKWVEELPSVLWAHHTTPRRSTGETPFTLCFGTQAIIHLEIGLPTLKSKVFNMRHNDMMLALDLTLIEEHRDLALACMVRYQQ